MMRGFRHLAGPVLAFCLFSICLAAQDIAPPIPQKMTLHSNILNEDRVVWVRTPHKYDKTAGPFAVLYLADGPNYINLIGGTMDFLAEGDRMPPLIIVGIANTDRTRDMTPSHSDEKNSDGSIAYPSSGGADRFIDFIQNELMPEIARRYRVAPYKIFVGHSFGAKPGFGHKAKTEASAGAAEEPATRVGFRTSPSSTRYGRRQGPPSPGACRPGKGRLLIRFHPLGCNRRRALPRNSRYSSVEPCGATLQLMPKLEPGTACYCSGRRVYVWVPVLL